MIPINRNNLLIIIVTYNPTKNLLQLLDRCRSFSNNIIIIDNGSQDKNIFSKISKKIRIVLSDINKGIAWGINEGIRNGDSNDIKWILTFDQDSLPTEQFIDYYNYVIENENNIGLIGCSCYAKNHLSPTKCKYQESLDLISSGLMHNKSTIKDIGLYDENLFIDYVDFEFVLRTKLKGYNTLIILNQILQHHLGTPKSKIIFKWRVNSTNHNSIRRYYRARNHVIILKKYLFQFPQYLYHKNNGFIGSLISMIIVDDNRIDKLKNTINGIIDGLRYNSLKQ